MSKNALSSENQLNAWYMRTDIQSSDSEQTSSLLQGQTIAIKDNVDVARHPTMWGARLTRDAAADDAPVVAALRRAGASFASGPMRIISAS